MEFAAICCDLPRFAAICLDLPRFASIRLAFGSPKFLGTTCICFHKHSLHFDVQQREFIVSTDLLKKVKDVFW